MWDVQAVRAQFPALQREQNGRPVVYFDGPAGSQVPQRVADAVSGYLLHTNANHAGPFATSRESDVLLDAAHRTFAGFLGCPDPDCVYFGQNMTTLTFALSRALGRTWKPGDQILVTRLDHDANVTPWVLAARDAGVKVQHVDVRSEDGGLDWDDFANKLNDRTKLVAVGYASNITGTINPLREIVKKSHAAGALVFVDAVHFAPHGLIDVQRLDCDFLACSAYKFFGPHVGVMYGKRRLLEEVSPYKLRPAPNELPGRWMTGTQSHEGIVGAAEAVRYLADLGRPGDATGELTGDSLRGALSAAFAQIVDYERDLAVRLVLGLAELPGVRIWGVADPAEFAGRVPTVSFTHESRPPREIASQLDSRGLFVWAGHHYALPFTEAMNLEPGGTVRIGLMHYNTADEVDRLLHELHEIC